MCHLTSKAAHPSSSGVLEPGAKNAIVRIIQSKHWSHLHKLGGLQYWASEWVLGKKTYFHSHLRDETAPRDRTTHMSSSHGETQCVLVLNLN